MSALVSRTTESNHVFKCRPLRAIISDVLPSELRLDPARGTAMLFSALLLVKYFAARFNCVMCSTLDFDIDRARHLITSEMSTRSCVKVRIGMVSLRNVVVYLSSRIGLLTIFSASFALSFVLGVLTILLQDLSTVEEHTSDLSST